VAVARLNLYAVPSYFGYSVSVEHILYIHSQFTPIAFG